MKKILLIIMIAALAVCTTSSALTDADIDRIAQTLYGECRGVESKAEQAAVAWCILNRLDAGDRGDTIAEVVVPSQFHGYKPTKPITDELRALAVDVVDRWERERAGETDVGRTLPREYLFFAGRSDGRNYFRTMYDYTDADCVYWDWALPDPYLGGTNMNNEEMTTKLVEVEQRGKSNTHRIDKLEEQQDALNSIATSVAVMATEQKTITKKVDDIDGKVDKLEKLPGQRWNGIVEKAITALIGAGVGYLLSRIGG